MAEWSGIEWTDHTLNLWIGCTEVSDACDRCYARTLMQDRFGRVQWGNHPRDRTSRPTWRMAIKWNEYSKRNYKRYGRNLRVFVNSLSDFFDNQVPDEWRADGWQLMRECPHLIFMLLTKRPQNIKKMLPPFWDEIKHRVWLGTTIEHQEACDRNLPHLCEVDAAVRYLSCEPLLGNIILPTKAWDSISLVIGGGESGGEARPWHPRWEEELREWCELGEVAYFWKQNGEWLPESELSSELQEDLELRGLLHVFIDGAMAVRRGKKSAGAEIDGEIYQEMPAVASVELRA